MTSIAAKLGIKEGMRSIFVQPPPGIEKIIATTSLDMKNQLRGMFDYIHLFVSNSKVFTKQFPKLKQHLQRGGMLWLSWPKGGKEGTDLTLTRIIKMGYNFGLVESKTISINDTWSAIKFTYPKEGKVYHNSYGKLKE